MKFQQTAAILLAVLGSVCGIPALAQPGTAAPALAGPSVPDRATRKTLVEYDFPGKVRRLDAAPEEIALRLMDLDKGLREKVDQVLNERVKQLDEFVGKNLTLLTKLQTASAAGDKLDQAMLLAEGVQKLAPVWTKGSLRAQVDQLLPKDKRAEFKALLDEYWDAIVSEQQAAPAQADDAAVAMTPASADAPAPSPVAAKPKAASGTSRAALQPSPKKKARWEILVAERLESFGREIERSFQRQLQSGDIIYRYIEAAIVMTDQQKGAIRDLCAEFAEKTRMNPTEAQNRELFVKIAGSLDTAQQTQLARLISGLKKPQPKK